MVNDLRVGLNLGYWTRGPEDHSEAVITADDLGYDYAFTAEAYGSDAFSTLAWYGSRTRRIKLGTAVAQIPARTPTATAMHALTIDGLSAGRMVLGLGASGPQVAEGWYGNPFPKPLARTREYVDIVRRVIAREQPVTSPGPHYPLPYPGGTGLGKPLKSIALPVRPRIPIFLGAEGPKNVALSAEIADGWLPLFIDPAQVDSIYGESLACRPDDFEIAATVSVIVSDDLDAALAQAKVPLAFYIGGMGHKSTNFHLDLIGRLGYADAAVAVQEKFLAGDRAGAIAAVPDELADSITLAGPVERIAERLQLWRDSPVTTVLFSGVRDEPTLRRLIEAARG